MTPAKEKELKLLANKGRMNIIRETHACNSGHPGGSMSSIDLMTYLYNGEMRIDPEDPKNENRDRFVLSKGHCAPGLYAVLAQRGYFPEEDLLTLRKLGSYLQGHPNMNTTPGVDFSTGSLGQGFSAAAGMANAEKNVLKKDVKEYAAQYKLDNLCIAVDVNGLQIDGGTKKVMNMEPIDSKFEAFGFNVVKIDGHDFGEIEKAFDAFHALKGLGKPMAILMKTTKGKGVSFMENQAGWHGKAPNDEQYAQAMAELEAEQKRIEEE